MLGLIPGRKTARLEEQKIVKRRTVCTVTETKSHWKNDCGSPWSSFSTLLALKGAGSRNRKQNCYLCNLYCCPHVAIVLCIDFGGWGESTLKLLLKIHQYLCNRTCECLYEAQKSYLQKYTFILRKVEESRCDMAYQKYCKIVVSKEVCLHYVTLPL